MDEHASLPEMLGSESDVPDPVAPSDSGAVEEATGPGSVDDDEIRLLTISSLEQVAEILQKYTALSFIRQPAPVFAEHLLRRRDAWFVELGETGLVYLTDILPRFRATLHVVSWDKNFDRYRREAIQKVLASAMELFDLQRIDAFAAEKNLTFRDRLRKMGFTIEGRVRRGFDGEDDLFLFGILKEETVQWQTLPHLMNTSA